jgi:NAD(P)-dependent dehydrogenase (short-subunit alcohol dehydrogenase family)
LKNIYSFDFLFYFCKMKRFNEKNVIITGAASGIGKGLAIALAAEGAVLLLLDINENAVKEVAKNIVENGGNAEADYLNVTDEARTKILWQNFATKNGRLDYVFNNAGYGMAEECHEIPTEQWQKMIDVNLMSVVHGAMEAFRIMKNQSSGGHIINTASLAGLIGSPGALPYATTKAAVVGLTKTLRVEGAAFNIRATALCPGFIDTGIYESAWSQSIPADMFRKTIPLPIIPLAEAILIFLKGILKNEQVIVLPRYGKIFYFFSKLLPFRLENKQIAGMAKFRKMKARFLKRREE